MNMIKYLKIYIKNISRVIVSAWLFIAYKALMRPLRMELCSYPDPVVFAGNALTLRWKLDGCHKIVINNSIILRGNINVVHLDAARLDGRLVLRFHGHRQIIEQYYPVFVSASPLKKYIFPVWQPECLFLPKKSERLTHVLVPHFACIHSFLPSFPESLQLKSRTYAPIAIKLPWLKIRPETFIQQEFNPNKIIQ